ncbi:acyl-[acyl-carrier-protein] desaturase [Parafrankia irregularis]|uniref:Acyl-[acyl-carrier-protein] desaturase n=1 Tax=Parafrankia irregularis TaxID=795642 RepID=A0A0S4QXC0_9ACTN|nr:MULTISPECIES: acyl-ACP desaturase [Parafrankia]MBE3203458.1 acyl-ACP desaturase [Parafrankia sp. CH37]CUU60183.1 acyl-[acyl-carrier-protein] desaturase [Parafrankia irregularis]
MGSPTDIDLLRELEPVAEANVNRHLSIAAEWMPHEYVPWSQGRDFDTTPWAPEQSVLSEAAQMAFEVNLLTEDNLPSYHREIAVAFGRDGAWGTWVGRWTAEEGRHAMAMRDYLLVTRAVDPVTLERDRMLQMQRGYDSGAKTALEAMTYVSFQELATRVSHRNTGRVTGEPFAEKLLSRVAADENLHMIFYRNLVAAALELAPERLLPIIRDELMKFEMPGTGIRDFGRKARYIAQSGIYDLRIHHDDVVAPILRHWKLFSLEGLSGEAAKAQADIGVFMNGLDALATRQAEKKAAAAARRAAREAQQPTPVAAG